MERQRLVERVRGSALSAVHQLAEPVGHACGNSGGVLRGEPIDGEFLVFWDGGGGTVERHDEFPLLSGVMAPVCRIGCEDVI
ncbi:hypothetical protein ACFYOG_37560 [Streptomyces sp. NPDC007818]|uniref:hypothetical protein n=1 Tax=Streptomyces sp. NPDC007818 TaxID=3364780 RepID=UPI00369CAE04